MCSHHYLELHSTIRDPVVLYQSCTNKGLCNIKKKCESDKPVFYNEFWTVDLITITWGKIILFLIAFKCLESKNLNHSWTVCAQKWSKKRYLGQGSQGWAVRSIRWPVAVLINLIRNTEHTRMPIVSPWLHQLMMFGQYTCFTFLNHKHNIHENKLNTINSYMTEFI